MSEKEIVYKLKRMGACGVLGTTIVRARRIFVDADRKGFKDVIRFLKNEGFTHLSTITGLEVDDGIELLYHLNKGGVELTVRINLPLNEMVVPTITDIVPGATLYEREVHDLLGIEFQGHPSLTPLILPDEWPEGAHPLRKHWTIEETPKEPTKKREETPSE
ncbi:MAG: Membrane-bound hydrogenase subunit beta [Candidatus Bathyarchaeota archaeon BA1]|nr:MAG: Membrane-bound hydrogenase subunit beta [Candidatus Bathyarchaeota archaeon BA1]